jgi:hypothetical protein
MATFAVLLALLAAGIGPTLLLGNLIRFRILAAPLAGLLLIVPATLSLYFIFQVTFAVALLAGSILTVAASAVLAAVHRPRVIWSEVAAAISLMAFASVGATAVSESATIRIHSPAVTYLDGFDILSYAHIADWLRDHISRPEIHAPAGSTRPRADPSLPYESLPELLLGNEARTGAFGFLAAIGTLRRIPSAFAYDPACAIILTSTILGVAAVFAGSWLALLVLLVGLAVSHWYDYAQAGYFAKSLAYPSILYLVGLVLKSRQDCDATVLAVLCAFAGGTALLLTGLVTAAVLCALCAPAALLAHGRERRIDWQYLSRIALCAFVAIAISGYLQHPVVGWDRTTFGTAVVGPKSLDLEGWNAITGYSDLTLTLMIVVALACAGILARAALLDGHTGPATLLIVPLVLYGLLLILHLRNELMQATGLIYPAMLCGAGWLISESKRPFRALPLAVLAACIAVTIGLRMPRAATALARYVGEAAMQSSYTEDELDRLAAAIGNRTALIDLGSNGQQCVLMSVELGRRGLSLQWTADSWYWPIRSWRNNWLVPVYHNRPDVIVVDAKRIEAGNPLYIGPHFAVVVAPDQKP